ncbi:MAG: sulfotransferase family 2 domain-containing protein [Okeania sp. SIO2C2]|nr:sulfotransferase family 2 domain-containing protein [Okeania sp. SIO2C2]
MHIPKTAGQSVHQLLINFLGKDKVCPARVNNQLLSYSKQEMDKYQAFSGHFDWCIFDNLPGPKFTFTVLREPRERILSFYFYLRKEANKLSQEELEVSEKQGLKAAFTLSPYDYFVNPKTSIRNFIDDHYDNFYTYYFAGRSYNGRSKLKNLIFAKTLKDTEDVLKLALENISTLDKVYHINDWQDRLEKDLSEITSTKSLNYQNYLVNQNKTIEGKDRLEKLKELGADKNVIQQIEQFCKLDNLLYKNFFPLH